MDINISQIDTVQGDSNNVIIDVRETDELKETGFYPEQFISDEHFNLDDSSLDKDKDYYIVCKAGGRSKRVQEYMKAHGYDAYNIGRYERIYRSEKLRLNTSVVYKCAVHNL